jgi:hypothetical protein
MLFKPNTVDEVCLQEQYLKNIGHNNQVVPRRKNTKMLPSMGTRSGKENTKRSQPLHIIERIQVTTITIGILMVTLKKSFVNYIKRRTLGTTRRMPRRSTF